MEYLDNFLDLLPILVIMNSILRNNNNSMEKIKSILENFKKFLKK
jgi:hypothetical protein